MPPNGDITFDATDKVVSQQSSLKEIDGLQALPSFAKRASALPEQLSGLLQRGTLNGTLHQIRAPLRRHADANRDISDLDGVMRLNRQPSEANAISTVDAKIDGMEGD